MNTLLKALVSLATTALLSGCGTMVYKPTSWFVYDFAENYALAYTLKGNDPGMGCAMAESTTNLLMSFSEVSSNPNELAIGMYMMSGACSEQRAQELGLSYLRAYKQQNVSEAKDIRIREKLAYKEAASRQYASYQFMVDEFGEPGGECPSLSEDEEFYWLLGILSGVQAVMNDLRAQSSVGVPKDLPMKAARGIRCIDNERWWQVPAAVQASVNVLLEEENNASDPWQTLRDASEKAAKLDVRLAHAIEIVVADGADNKAYLREALRRHAKSVQDVPRSKQYHMIDLVASQQITAISDRLWTEATGSRTPVGGLGTFWDDVSTSSSSLDVDDLLSD